MPEPTPHPAAPTDPTIAADNRRPPSSPPPEQTRLGRYRILQPLGHGGMGFVFRAWHEGLERAFALKVIQPTAHAPASVVERFLLEARAVARIGKHPNIVQVHDAGQEGPYYYIAMDLVEGEPLHQRLRGGPLDPREAARIARGVASGLQVAHEAGIVHRDLKPSNILLSREGTPLVTDFGIARDAATSPAQAPITTEGEVLGTLFYMAPEQAAGERARIGPATDVYGLGATLYEMLTGRPPFSGANQFEVWTAIVGELPRAPRAVRPSVPAALEAICLKALAKAPPQRYASAKEMGEDLDRFLAGEPVQARAPSAVTRLVWRAARRKGVLLPLAAAFLVAAAGLAWVAESRARRAQAVSEAQAQERREQAAASASAAARRSAEEQEAEAKETLRKANLAQAVLARWTLLLPTLATMERDFFDSTLSKAEKQRRSDAAWPAVEAFMRDTPDDAASRATMLAFAGWARCLTVRQVEGLDWMAQARALDGDLPYADVLEALVHLSRYLEEDQLPGVFRSTYGVEVAPAPPERPVLRELRARIESLLDAASKRRVWGEGVGSDFRRVADAIRAMQAGRYEEAEKGFGEVLGAAALAGFRADFVLARGKVRFLLGRYDDALSDLDRVVEARPGQGEVYYFRGLVHAARGDRASAEGRDTGEEYARAIAEFDASGERIPGFYFASLAKGTAWMAEARARELRGREAKECLDRAIGTLDEVLRTVPHDPTALLNRGLAYEMKAGTSADPLKDLDRAIADLEAVTGSPQHESSAREGLEMVYLRKGQIEMEAGQDPRDSLHHVVELCEAELRSNPDPAEVVMNRGLARACEGDWMAATGQDPRALWKQAHADFERAIQLAPRLWNARANLGMLLVQEGRPEEAIPVYEEALKARPGEPQLLQGLARAKETARAIQAHRPAWWRDINDATRDARAGKYAASRKEYEAAFEKVTKEEEKDAHWQPILADAHYNLACSYALLSVGKEEPSDAARTIGADEAAAWRDKTFDHLRRARELGWRDLAHMKEDPDLAPLHDDARWAEVIAPPPR